MTEINGKYDKILIFEKAEKLVLGRSFPVFFYLYI